MQQVIQHGGVAALLLAGFMQEPANLADVPADGSQIGQVKSFAGVEKPT
jgi:hypothetical protein